MQLVQKGSGAGGCSFQKGFPQKWFCCWSSTISVTQVEDGQRVLATLLAESGYRGRGRWINNLNFLSNSIYLLPHFRPRKDVSTTPGDSKVSKMELVDSQVGKRIVKLPKRFEETIHSLKKGDGDLERESTEDTEDTEEDITVTIDLTESKASQNNPVIAEINSILNQFDHQSDRRKSPAGDNPDLSCEVCEKSFEKEKKLTDHVQSAHGQIMYKCEVASCNALLKSKEELASHQQSAGHQEFIILVIGAPADSLIANGSSSLGDDSTWCNLCETDLGSNTKLAAHKSTAHPKEEVRILSNLFCNLIKNVEGSRWQQQSVFMPRDQLWEAFRRRVKSHLPQVIISSITITINIIIAVITTTIIYHT